MPYQPFLEKRIWCWIAVWEKHNCVKIKVNAYTQWVECASQQKTNRYYLNLQNRDCILFKIYSPILPFSSKGILLKVTKNPCTVLPVLDTHSSDFYTSHGWRNIHFWPKNISITIWKWAKWWVWSLCMHTYYYSVLTCFSISISFS